MAYRFGNYKWIRDGALDNHVPGKTTGHIEMANLGLVTLELTGDMQGELKGHTVNFCNPDYDPGYVFDHGPYKSDAATYLDGFSVTQRGEVGDVTCQPYFYLEWYSRENGRCVIELDREHCHIGSVTRGDTHVE